MQRKFVFVTATLVVVMTGLMGAMNPVVRIAKAADEVSVTETPKLLVISAVQITGGVGRTNEDFIEIFNPNPTPFNLNDYRLVKRTATATTDTSIKSWTSDTFIPPYSFYLWANSSFTTITLVPDLVSSVTLADNNGVAIRKGDLDSGELVDSLAWGVTTNGFNSSGVLNPTEGESVIRDSLFETSVYSLHLSNPRNSTNQQLPLGSDEDPPLVLNDALCSISELSKVVEPNSLVSVDLEYTNSGTTPWNSLDYFVVASDGQNLTLPSDSATNSGQNWATSVGITTPQTAGIYSYQWQMAFNGIGFGQSCVLSVTVEDTSPIDDPPVDDPPPVVVIPTIKITEILPNPKGKDPGREIIELYNYGTQSVMVDSWVLDNILPTQDLSSKAFIFSNITIEPNQYFAITVPVGKFVMNNTKGGVVTLFDGEEQIIDSVSYLTKAPEGKSYASIDGAWKWLDPSFGIQNFEPEPQLDEQDLDSNPDKEVGDKSKVTTKAKPAINTPKKSSKAKAVVKKIVKSSVKSAKNTVKKVKAKTSKTTAEPAKKISTKTEPKPEPSPERQKSSGAAGPIAIAIASLGAGGLAVYRFGMGGGL